MEEEGAEIKMEEVCGESEQLLPPGSDTTGAFTFGDDLAPVEDILLKTQSVSVSLGSDGEEVEPTASLSGKGKKLRSKRKVQQDSKSRPRRKRMRLEVNGKSQASKALNCPSCSLEFADPESLHYHLKRQKCRKSVSEKESNSSGSLAPYGCAVCDKVFQSMDLLFRHSCQQNHRVHMFRCSICSAVFDSTSLLSDHVGQHNIPKAFQCGLCGSGFHENNLLLNHLKTCDKEQKSWYNCSVCSLQFSEVSDLGHHVKTIHPTKMKQYRCGICLKDFSNKVKFTAHVTSHKNEQEEAFQRRQTRSVSANVNVAVALKKKCKTSNGFSTLKTKEKQKKRAVTSLRVKLVKIPSDEENNDNIEGFSDTPEDDEELEKQAEEELEFDQPESVDTDQTFDCDECGVRLSSAKALRNHREFHPSNDNYSVDCDKCNTTFVSLNLLKAHLQEKGCEGYRCTQCPRSFALEALLLVHVARAHSDPSDEVLSCENCPKTFTSMLKFSRHAGTHAKNKPFLCKMCGHRYVHPDHLFVHLKKIHGIDKEKCLRKKVQCKVCNKEFADDQALTFHSKYHSEEEVQNAKGTQRMLEKVESPEAVSEIKDFVEVDNTKEYNVDDEYFDCDVCGDRLLDVKDFVKHRNDHFFNSKFTIQCHCCGETFANVADIKKHVKTKKCPGFKCSKCKRSFGLQTALLSHEAKEHAFEALESGVYKCHKCLKSFENRMAYIRHAATHADIKSFQCSLCCSWYTTVEYVQTHIRLSHKPEHDGMSANFECENCGVSFRSQEALDNHKKYHSTSAEDSMSNGKVQGRSYYSCNNCPKIFWRYNALVKHMKSHLKSLTKKKKSLMCSICKKTFRENYELQRHVGTHTRPYLCSSCGKSFSLPWSLKEHMKAYHSKENPYRCEFCNKNYSTSNSLRLHRRIHTGEKNFQCEFCEKVFVDLSYLKSHKKSHFPDKPFKCTICSYSSKHKSGLSRHMLSHKQEKNHFCPICHKAFTQRGHVKTHMKLHTKIKNHVCTVCGSAFARHDYLKIHMRTHTNEKPYSCPVCSRAFAMSSNMLSHIKKTHPDYNYQYKHLRVNYNKPPPGVLESSEATETVGGGGDVALMFPENSAVTDTGTIPQQQSSSMVPVTAAVEESIGQHPQLPSMEPLHDLTRHGNLDNLNRHPSVSRDIVRLPNISEDMMRQGAGGNAMARFSGLGNDLVRHGGDMVRHANNMAARHASEMTRPSPADMIRPVNIVGNDMQRLGGGEISRANTDMTRQGGFVAPGQEYMYVYPNFSQGPYMQDFLQPYHKKRVVTRYGLECMIFLISYVLKIVMNPYDSQKKLTMEGAMPGAASTSVPSFYMHSIPYTAPVFPAAPMAPNPYGFSLDGSSYPHQTVHCSPLNVPKMNSGNTLADIRHLNMTVAKPSPAPPIDPASIASNCVSAGNILPSHVEMGRTSLDDVLNTASGFSNDGPLAASLLAGKCAYSESQSSGVIAGSRFNHQVQPESQGLQPRAGLVSYGGDECLKVEKEDNIECRVTSPPSPVQVVSEKNSRTVNADIYKCGICGESFCNNDHLCSHLASHTSSMPYQCGLCGIAFFEGSLLTKHVQEFHSPKDPYQCGICSATFSANTDYCEHMKACSDIYNGSAKEKVEKLMIKNLSTTDFAADDDPGDSSEPEREHYDESGNYSKSIVDELGGQREASSTILVGASGEFSMRKKRTKIVMEDVDLSSVCTVIVEPSSAGGERKKHVYKCKFCDKLCKDRGQIVSHVRVHTKVRPYECSVCFMKFKQYGHLRDHMMRHTKERPYVCDRCAKSFPRSSHLSEHIRLRHTEDRLYHCPECSETFQKRKDFSKHKRSHGRKPKYQCNICSKKFFNVTDYERHCRSHTKEKQFECEVCHMTFGLLANAKKHMKVHSQHKPHKCPVCGKAFHFSNDLKRHEATHLKKKPFPCSDCYKSFKTEALLKAHSKIHVKEDANNTERPFQCKTCKKCFKLKWDLARHEKTHLKKKPFPCPDCYKSFGSEAMLKKHSRMHVGVNVKVGNEDENFHCKNNFEEDEVSDDGKEEESS
ncbi:uncharacterized protein LOC101860255 [Aplysia californica]|uniref:Uncharacterized protein LOC101860255 n=1 Tax=Aplysia californica TaxID=6500 RepID=A0ABM1VV63_APLCA|nr:uncharacterized protein LOC101860255 [Aplysia californica]